MEIPVDSVLNLHDQLLLWYASAWRLQLIFQTFSPLPGIGTSSGLTFHFVAHVNHSAFHIMCFFHIFVKSTDLSRSDSVVVLVKFRVQDRCELLK